MADVSIIVAASAFPKLLKDDEVIVPGANLTAIAAILGDITVNAANLKFTTKSGATVEIQVTPGPF